MYDFVILFETANWPIGLDIQTETLSLKGGSRRKPSKIVPLQRINALTSEGVCLNVLRRYISKCCKKYITTL